MGVCVCACVVMPVANVCSQLDSAICSCGSGSGGYNIHMQQSTSPIVRHPARHGSGVSISTRYQCEAHSHSCIHMRILYHSQFEPQRVAPQSLHKVHSNTNQLEFSTFGASTRHSKCMSGDT
jgi:hypothetical protein